MKNYCMVMVGIDLGPDPGLWTDPRPQIPDPSYVWGKRNHEVIL